jgi:hypothetical protein
MDDDGRRAPQFAIARWSQQVPAIEIVGKRMPVTWWRMDIDQAP